MEANEHSDTNGFELSDLNIVKNIDAQVTPCCNINLSKTHPLNNLPFYTSMDREIKVMLRQMQYLLVKVS